MFYILAEENDLLAENYSSDEQVSNMNLWSDIDELTDHLLPGKRCPRCNRTFDGDYIWGPEKKVKFYSSRYPDLLLHRGSSMIFSEKAKELITANDLRGISSFEKIKIVGRHVPDCNYYDTQVSFVESRVDWKHSKIKKKDLRRYSDCELCGLVIWYAKRISLEEEFYASWDIFHLYSWPHRFIVSEKFRTVFETANLANVRFIPLENFSF